MAIAASALVAASARERPGEIAAVLGLARMGVLLVGIGTLLVVVSGLWLIEETGRSVGDGWIAISLALLAGAGLLGTIGGRKPKRARLLAESKAADSPPDPAIRALLTDRSPSQRTHSRPPAPRRFWS